MDLKINATTLTPRNMTYVFAGFTGDKPPKMHKINVVSNFTYSYSNLAKEYITAHILKIYNHYIE